MAIVARELEEKAMTATMMDACVTGSILFRRRISSGEPAVKGEMVERARKKE
jgi:hypothetical protein